MLWVATAIVGCLCFGICNVFDRQAAARTPQLFPAELLAVGSFLPFVAYGFLSFVNIEAAQSVLVPLALYEGVLWAASTLLYFMALAEVRAEYVSIFMQSQPAIALVIESLLLGKGWSPVAPLGLAFLVLSAALLSYPGRNQGGNEVQRKRHFTAVALILFACFGWTSGSFMLQAAQESAPISAILFSKMLGVSGLTLGWSLARNRGNFLQKLAMPDYRRAFSLVATSGAFNMLGLAAVQVSLMLASATAVSAVAATEPVFVFVLVTLVSRWFPSLAERGKLDVSLGRFFAAMGLAVAGAALVVV